MIADNIARLQLEYIGRYGLARGWRCGGVVSHYRSKLNLG